MKRTQNEILEYWFTMGMSKGLPFEEAVEYAEEQLQNK
jgi:hypothetical protein